MNEITLKNYRCFSEEQVARLAPLTLLVGENSTGKTSFLAIIRALWDCTYGYRNPNFKEAPFDLGSFFDIVHHQVDSPNPVHTFEARLRIDQDLGTEIVFGNDGTAPIPINVRFVDGDTWIESYIDDKNNPWMLVGTCRGAWKVSVPTDVVGRRMPLLHYRLALPLIIPELFNPNYLGLETNFVPLGGSPPFSKKDTISIAQFRFLEITLSEENRPYASAPVRSKPQRTYDPASHKPDSEGDHVPMLLSRLANDNLGAWENLKRNLEQFGSAAGIFDEIHVKHLGKSVSDPFQLQIRKLGKKQNLIDVGYGISQVLPILTGLFLPSSSHMALLQQPEVHLHPSAQAALGSLFCDIASQGRQLIIETHSDHLIDRVRMDVRDGKTKLKPNDVSILFFEQRELDVKIHSLRVDEEGNILGPPSNYGKFFMEEIQRSLRL